MFELRDRRPQLGGRRTHALLLLAAAAAAAAAAPRDAAVVRCLERSGASCAPSADDEAKKLGELREARKTKADEQPTVEAADADAMPSVGRGAADLPAPRFRLPPKGYAVSYGRLIRVGAPTPHPADRGAAARHDAAVAAEATPRAPPSARVRERGGGAARAERHARAAKAPPWWDRPPVWMRDTPWWLRRFAEKDKRPAFVKPANPDLERQGGGGGGGWRPTRSRASRLTRARRSRPRPRPRGERPSATRDGGRRRRWCRCCRRRRCSTSGRRESARTRRL